jgi:hypothetical protein
MQLSEEYTQSVLHVDLTPDGFVIAFMGWGRNVRRRRASEYTRWAIHVGHELLSHMPTNEFPLIRSIRVLRYHILNEMRYFAKQPNQISAAIKSSAFPKQLKALSITRRQRHRFPVNSKSAALRFLRVHNLHFKLPACTSPSMSNRETYH